MRSIASCLLLIVALFAARAAYAQTFDSPWTFNQNPYAQAGNTCTLPTQYMVFPEFGYVIQAPTAVYRVWNLPRIFGPPIQYKPWHVSLSPVWDDLSIWVCRTRSGYALSNCVDASDNGFGIMNQVTVPGQIGSFYVIVTGNIDNATPQCGNYTLSAYY